MSAASVGIKHGSRRHGVCTDCSGHGLAGHLEAGGGDGSPEGLYGPYPEDPEDLKAEGDEDGEEEDLKWKEEAEISQDEAILENDKDGTDSAPEQENPEETNKDFTWIS